jgi:siderophore synthetase component
VGTAIGPTLAMYLLYGIAFEAHQQNSTILFDESGRPRKLLIRDFGDGRSFAPLFKERGHHLKPFTRTGILPTTFDDDISLVRSFVIDACFVCHLHEVALCLDEHYTLSGTSLWRILREEVEAVFDALRPRMLSDAFWLEERKTFLEKPWPSRSVLRMHLERYRDYRVEHELPNPMAGAE